MRQENVKIQTIVHQILGDTKRRKKKIVQKNVDLCLNLIKFNKNMENMDPIVLYSSALLAEFLFFFYFYQSLSDLHLLP
jgi:hypothetical protein